jgi:uncharacterized protein YecT (DUF1311 family)
MNPKMYKISIIIIFLIFIYSCQNKTKNDSNAKGVNSQLLSDSIIDINQTKIQIDTFYFDKFVHSCLSTSDGQTTLGMIQCLDSATVYLDSILHNSYDSLLVKLDITDQKKLKASQENWMKFRIAEFDFLYSSFYTWANFSKYGHGREDAILQAEWKYNIVRERLINLIKYNEGIYVEDTK